MPHLLLTCGIARRFLDMDTRPRMLGRSMLAVIGLGLYCSVCCSVCCSALQVQCIADAMHRRRSSSGVLCRRRHVAALHSARVHSLSAVSFCVQSWPSPGHGIVSVCMYVCMKSCMCPPRRKYFILNLTNSIDSSESHKLVHFTECHELCACPQRRRCKIENARNESVI